MARFAEVLSRDLNGPVVDLTESPGAYDFKLTWAIDGDANDDQSSLLAALQSQLDVKLQSRKLPLDLIVVDKAEKTKCNFPISHSRSV